MINCVSLVLPYFLQMNRFIFAAFAACALVSSVYGLDLGCK